MGVAIRFHSKEKKIKMIQKKYIQNAENAGILLFIHAQLVMRAIRSAESAGHSCFQGEMTHSQKTIYLQYMNMRLQLGVVTYNLSAKPRK